MNQILTTHVGSLPRPPELLALLQARAAGRPPDTSGFARVLQAAVDEVVARQVAVGIDMVSDGEMSKPSYATYITERLSGFGGESRGHTARDLQDYKDFARHLVRLGGVVPTAGGARCKGPVSLRDTGALEQDLHCLAHAVERSQPARAFMNAASPGVVTVFQLNEYYPSQAAYVDAVAAVMRHEYESIANAGFDLQIDCPDLAMGRHLAYADLDERGFLRIAEYNVDALNEALANIPAERLRMHVCWGNYAGPHHHDIPLRSILPTVLKARPKYLLLEAANPRHEHEWQIFRETPLPDDKILVPGVIDSTSNYIEHPDLVAQRLLNFAAVVGPERVVAGSDCGFATFSGYPTVWPDIAWAKLESMVEGARRASAML